LNENRIIITEYIEANCPYCRYVEMSIIRDIIAKRDTINRMLVKSGNKPMPIIELKLVDVDANDGSKDGQWFEQYSKKIGGRFTPVIKVGDTGKTHYLWGKEKQETISEKQISATAKLKNDILQEIQQIITSVDLKGLYYNKDFYNPKRHLHQPPVKMMYQPFGGYQ
jgi:glutaredoxin